MPQIIPVPLISTAHIKGLYIMDEDDTTKPSSAGQRNHIRISKLDILVIFFVLTIAVLVSFVFDANLGVSVVIVFCASLAVRDAILAPYKTQTSEKIMTMFVSCLVMGFTGFAIAITFAPLRLTIVGGVVGILFVLGLYLGSPGLAVSAPRCRVVDRVEMVQNHTMTGS